MSDHSSAAGQPNLRDTISFLDKTLRSETTFIAAEQNLCNIEIVRNKHRQFVLPTGGVRSTTNEFGVMHSDIEYAIVQEAPLSNFAWVPLRSIDPDSIKSGPALSREYATRTHLADNPAALRTPDLTVILFTTRNKEKTIREGNTLSKGDTGTIVFNEQGTSSGGIFVFDAQDSAERFVTAFVHAVKLCGGKTSDFASTPRK